MSQLIDRLMRVRKGEIFTPLIDAHMRKHREDPFSPFTLSVLFELAGREPRERRGSFSVSQLATCMRYQGFRYHGAEGVEVPDGRLHSIFHDGHWRHLRWQGLLLEVGVVCWYRYEGSRLVLQPPPGTDKQQFDLWADGYRPALEVPLTNHPLRLSGTLDVIATVTDLDDAWVLDVKGANPGAFAAARRRDIPRGYRWQLELYRQLMAWCCDTPPENAMLFYEDKASQSLHEHHLEPETVDLLAALSRLRALNQLAGQRRLAPPLPNAPANPACRTCPYQLDCLGGLDGLDEDEVPI